MEAQSTEEGDAEPDQKKLKMVDLQTVHSDQYLITPIHPRAVITSQLYVIRLGQHLLRKHQFSFDSYETQEAALGE